MQAERWLAGAHGCAGSGCASEPGRTGAAGRAAEAGRLLSASSMKYWLAVVSRSPGWLRLCWWGAAPLADCAEPCGGITPSAQISAKYFPI